jgi:hypothetical protein
MEKQGKKDATFKQLSYLQCVIAFHCSQDTNSIISQSLISVSTEISFEQDSHPSVFGNNFSTADQLTSAQSILSLGCI